MVKLLEATNMEIIQAQAMGMCFGVRDALETSAQIENPTQVTIHGQLVHNPQVIARLQQRGYATCDEADRSQLPSTPSVMITAHGISDAERQRLLAAGKHLIDTTCPLVRRAHRVALQLQADGYHVLVIGQPTHVEVQGLTGDLTHFDIIPSESDVRPYNHPRLGILCQTTSARRDVERIRQAVQQLNPASEIRFIDTVCQPTKDRQDALDRLLDRVDTMVVIGGHNSNNTRKLLARCHDRRIPAHHVQGPADLDPTWFTHSRRVGVTAGTSTLDTTIQEVCQALTRLESRTSHAA